LPHPVGVRSSGWHTNWRQNFGLWLCRGDPNVVQELPGRISCQPCCAGHTTCEHSVYKTLIIRIVAGLA